MSWEDKGVTKVENMYSVTAMDWKPDGDKLAVGTLCGKEPKTLEELDLI